MLRRSFALSTEIRPLQARLAAVRGPWPPDEGPLMRYEVRLPQLSMGMSDAEILDWYVEDGELVPEGADLVEIEAEKARQVLPAPVAGVVRELQGDQGDVVEVRGLLCVIETSD